MNKFMKVMIGAGVTLAAISAVAAPANAATGDRVQGKLVLYAQTPNYWIGMGVAPGVGDNVPTPGAPDTATGAGAAAAVYSLPAIGGGSGPIVDPNGLCLTTTAAYDWITAQVCDGTPGQQWSQDAAGHLINVLTSATLTASTGSPHPTGYYATTGTNAQVVVVSSYLSPAPAAASLSATVTSVDQTAKSAVLSGTGQPGATVTVAAPTGNVTTTVAADGTWTVGVSGLAEGQNTLPVTQTVNGTVSAPVTVTVIVNPLETPLADPMIAGGAALVLLAAAGTKFALRRKVSH